MTPSEYALNFLGTPYHYGGNTPEQGIDCSGLVCEALRVDGTIGREDLTAQQIFYQLLARNGVSEIEKESILFFGKNTGQITHVGIAINKTQFVESGGEGRQSTDKGMVRVRPVNSRKDLVASIKI